MSDRHIRRSGDDYAEALTNLLPTGPAWPRDPESVVMKTVRGLAQIWGFVDGRAADLLERESDPRATVELLQDWERAWGLPDPCFAEPFAVADRQRMLVNKMTMLGGQSRAFFEALGTSLGYDIKVREWAPFMAGVSRVGDTRRIVGHTQSLPDALAEYPLDDASGDDASGNGYDATVTGDPVVVTGDNWLQLTGDDWLGIETSFGLVGTDGSLDDFTVMGWFKTSAADGALFGLTENFSQATPGTWIPLLMIEDGHLRAELMADTAGTILTTSILNDGAAHHVALTKQGNMITLFADGAVAGSLVYDAIDQAWWNAFWIGTSRINSTDWAPLVGAMRDVRVYDQALSADAIAGIVAEVLNPPPEGADLRGDDYRWEIGAPEMRFYWAVRVAAVRLTWFRAASGQAGIDPHLRIGLATDLECIIRRYAPAQTEVIFDYSGVGGISNPMQGTP